ncbi:hypothetical protein HDU98_003716, partial [Podochytrium sp. JEL0797]
CPPGGAADKSFFEGDELEQLDSGELGGGGEQSDAEETSEDILAAATAVRAKAALKRDLEYASAFFDTDANA